MTATNPDHTITDQVHDAEVIELRPGTTNSPDTTAIETKVLEAEIVDDNEDQEQDEPAVSTEVAVPAKTKTKIAVPASVRTAATRVGEIAKRPDRLALAVLKHQLLYGSVGTARATGALWDWMTAVELYKQLEVKPELVLTTRRKRRNIVLTGAGTTATAGTLAWFLLTPAVPIIAILMVLAVAGGLERRRVALGDAEAGHASLGGSPSSKEVKKVLVAAGLAKRIDDLRMVGPVTRTGDAWEATADLPPGTTYKVATTKRGAIAAAIGVDEIQVALDPVKGHNGRVRLWVADEDPMQGDRIQNPLVASEGPVNFWKDRLFAGADARGRALTFSMVERSYLIGGEPGGGKSVASNNVLAFFFLDPRIKVYLADGKFGTDLMMWEPMAAGVLTDKNQGAMLPFIAEICDEMERRYALKRKLRVQTFTEADANKYGLHPIVLHIDEIQYWTASGDSKLDKACMTAIADIVARGRAVGIIVGVVTQRPAAEVVPTRLRDILSIRWALRCTAPAASDTILGQGWAGRGYSASLIQPDQRGAGYILAEGSSPVQLRSAFIDPGKDEIDTIAARAYDLRKAAGTLPATDDRAEIRLLTAILEAMTHPKGIHTKDLLPALAAASDEYADWDSARLSATVKGLGLIPGQLDIEGTNRNGYRRDRTQNALDNA